MLGRRIREIREQERLTLKEVADGIDMTPSLISYIERGKANPSISILKDIANLFGMRVGALLDSNINNPDHDLVLRKGERKILTTARNAKYQLLSHGYDMNCELCFVEFAPRASTGEHRLTVVVNPKKKRAIAVWANSIPWIFRNG